MRKEIQLNNEILKMRKIMNAACFTEEVKNKAWIVLLTLQWVKRNDIISIGPLDFAGVLNLADKARIKRKKK